MTLMPTFNEMRAISRGFPQQERAAWSARGWKIIEPSPQPCLLPNVDWHPDSFLAVKNKEVLISVILAKIPGDGSWRRLMKNLTAFGIKEVTVICPLAHMEQVLKHTGFKGPFTHGSTFADRYQYWRKYLK